MSRLLYERSVSYLGYLIIPFVFTRVDGEAIYSYVLLSALGRKGEFHRAENPAGIYSSEIDEAIDIAEEHLEDYSDSDLWDDYFQNRYTYHDNLIITYQIADKCFYDHYPPDSLQNIAAPKIFETEFDCIQWVKSGLDRRDRDKHPENISG